MSSRVFAPLLVVALVYGAFVVAHERFDRELPGRPDLEEEAGDLGDRLRPLLADGLAALPRVREALAAEGDAGADLLEFLPRAGEPWQGRLADLLAETEPGPRPRVELTVAEPRGRQVGPRPGLFLRREQSGRAFVEVLPEAGDEPIVGFEAPVNQWSAFPEELVLESGRRYRLRLRQDAVGAVVAEDSFELIDGEESAGFLRAMTLLKQHVADPRLRVYLQGVIAMSRELHAEATEIYLKRMPRPDDGREERGLVERLAFLLDRRGELVARDRALARLRETR